MFKSLMLLSLLFTLVACGGKSSGTKSPEKTAEAIEEDLKAGNKKLSEINELEKDMEEKGYLLFSKEYENRNGVMEEIVKLSFTGDEYYTEDLQAALDYLEQYIPELAAFLEQYPESEYDLFSRKELEAKLDLAQQMKDQIQEFFQ